jgi:ferredoxin
MDREPRRTRIRVLGSPLNEEPAMTRQDRRIREREHDPYKTRMKLVDPSACTECHANYRDGRWQWGSAPMDAHRVVCPACQRIRDDCPAGALTLAGRFHLDHRPEILGLLRHVEEREVKQRALKRIMAVEETGDEVHVTTADANLARNLGDALHHAYQGDLDYAYPEEGGILRVRWQR